MPPVRDRFVVLPEVLSSWVSTFQYGGEVGADTRSFEELSDSIHPDCTSTMEWQIISVKIMCAAAG